MLGARFFLQHFLGVFAAAGECLCSSPAPPELNISASRRLLQDWAPCFKPEQLLVQRAPTPTTSLLEALILRLWGLNVDRHLYRRPQEIQWKEASADARDSAKESEQEPQGG